MSAEERLIASSMASADSASSSSMETDQESSTPKQPSSVFLTPPSSSRKPPTDKPPSLLAIPWTQTLHLDLLSPEVTPDLYRPQGYPDSPPSSSSSSTSFFVEFLDVVGELYLCGRGHITEMILLYLDPSDLCRCLQVCSRWSELVSSNDRLMAKVTALRKSRKDNSENLEKNFKDSLWVPEQRRALSTIAAPNIQPLSHAKPTSSSNSYHPLPTNRFRHCPNCQSPAKELNLRRAECTRCHFDFCQSCFKPWHGDRGGDCTRSRSPKKARESASSLCGTKKSKKRLKRL